MSGKHLDGRIIASLIEQLQIIQQKIENINVEPIEDAFVLIDRLKTEDKDTEEKITLAYGYIDKIIARLDKKEISQSIEDCETVNKHTIFWDGLDSSSQKFLCTADFLYSYLQKINKDDFSPAAIEFCRTLENELFLRIFKEFIIDIIESHGGRIESLLSLLAGDIEKEETRTLAYKVIKGRAGQDLFLTLGQMQFCLYRLSKQDFSSSFVLMKLRDFISNNFKLDISLESEIALGLKDFADKYRNKAVHRDILDIECVKESKEAVICYLALISRYKSKSSEGQRISIEPVKSLVGKISKRKNNLNDGKSEIDKSDWKPPPDTFIFPKPIKPGYQETFPSSKKRKPDCYKYCIVWNGAKPKELDFKTNSQMSSLFTLFATKEEDNPLVSKKDIKHYLGTKQIPYRAVRDLNEALVDQLRRKFPTEKARIDDLIIGYSKVKDGYVTLIPIYDESKAELKADTLDKEEHLPEEPPNEFLKDVRVMKRGGKKM